jgi:hypothetical protein
LAKHRFPAADSVDAGFDRLRRHVHRATSVLGVGAGTEDGAWLGHPSMSSLSRGSGTLARASRSVTQGRALVDIPVFSIRVIVARCRRGMSGGLRLWRRQ